LDEQAECLCTIQAVIDERCGDEVKGNFQQQALQQQMNNENVGLVLESGLGYAYQSKDKGCFLIRGFRWEES
jgi:hypothetical protein